MKKRIIAIMCVAVVLIMCLVVPVGAEEGSGILVPRPDASKIEFTQRVGSIFQAPAFAGYPYMISGQFYLNENVLYDPVETLADLPVTETYYNISIASILRADQDPSVSRLSLVYTIDNEFIVQGDIVFRFMVDPDYSSISYLQQVFARELNGNMKLLWDQVDGFVLGHNPLLNFGVINEGLSGQGLTDNGYKWFSYYLDSSIDSIDHPKLIDGFSNFTAWLFTAVEGFFDFPLIGGQNGFTIGHMFGAVVGLSITLLILKFIAGG